MIIDSHQHVFWHGRDDAGLIADMDEHKIDLAWLLTWEIAVDEDDKNYHNVLNPLNVRPDGTHAGIVLRDLIQAKTRYPNRFVLGYCPHPTLKTAPKMFEAAYHMHGLRVCGEWKFRLPFDDPRCIELFRVAGSLNCPVVLHLDVPYLVDASGANVYQPHWFGGTVANLERALQACPQTKFIGHAPGFWREISAGAESDPSSYPLGPVKSGGKLYDLLDRYPNLYADLSANSGRGALSRDNEHAKAFLTRYADRLLFARDIYGQDLHNYLKTLELSESIREKLYHQNATKLLAPR